MEEKVRKLIEEEVNKQGIKIDSINYEKEGSNYFLRIVIDRDKAIDIDTCGVKYEQMNLSGSGINIKFQLILKGQTLLFYRFGL